MRNRVRDTDRKKPQLRQNIFAHALRSVSPFYTPLPPPHPSLSPHTCIQFGRTRCVLERDMYCITCIASLMHHLYCITDTYIYVLTHVLHHLSCIRRDARIASSLHQQRTALTQQHSTYVCVYEYICQDTCMCVYVYIYNVLQKSTTLHQNSPTFHESALQCIKRALHSMKRALQSRK